MDEQSHSAEPTATSLKAELRASLEVLKRDFECLKHVVSKLSSNGVAAPISLTRGDVNELLSIALEIHDAASEIEFEAEKVKEQLEFPT